MAGARGLQGRIRSEMVAGDVLDDVRGGEGRQIRRRAL